MDPFTAVNLAIQTAPAGVGPDELGEFWPSLVRTGWFIAGFLLVWAVGWYVVEPALSRGVRRRNQNNPTLHEAITRYLRLTVVVIAAFVGAGMAGYGQFLASSALVVAAATLAIGVAGQTVIGSLISGLVLVIDPEFNVGNYIEWDDREGTVRSITLRVTRVHTPGGELVTIPNTVLTSQAITRPFGRGRYRIVEHVGLAYEDDVDAAIAHLEAAAEGIESILDEPESRAYVDDFASDAVVLRVHYWIEDPRRRDVFGVRSAYARALKRRLDAAGITISPASKRDLQGRISIESAASTTDGQA